MYRILFIEDCASTGPLLLEYFTPEQGNLARLTDRHHAGGDYHQPSGVIHHESGEERAAGQLIHLNHALKAFVANEREAVDDEREAVAAVRAKIFPLDQLGQLSEAAAIANSEKRTWALQELMSRFGDLDQMILVVDLALAPGEAERLDAAGARDVVTATSRLRKYRDARSVLRETSGFRVMQALNALAPVIVTTYSSSPLLKQHCLVSGAFAVVEKPVMQRHKKDFDMFTAAQRTVPARENSARANGRALDVVVTHYATTIASEVLKAMSARIAGNLSE